MAFGYSDITTLVTPGGTITHGSGGFFIDPSASSGLGLVFRGYRSPRGQASGAILHDAFEDGARIVLAGIVDTDVIATRDSLISTAKTALRSISLATSTGTLTWGGTAITVNIDPDTPVDFPMWGTIRKRFIYGLVSASPIF